MTEFYLIILLANIFTTIVLTGIAWYTQIAHYPLFRHTDKGEEGGNYFKAHQQQNLVIMAPFMVIELLTALVLISAPFSNEKQIALWFAFAIVIFIWAYTYFKVYPLHVQLTRGYSEVGVEDLIRHNWARIIAWSTRSLILLWVVYGLFHANCLWVNYGGN
ncbi:MAG: hypothetical protein H7A37_09340 [Chlamydiales bacterium]|nr:hypothetical protein [Chlamydiia bacterium]MCP5508480.1 hypothetical protein [Chlamydiales bacterium]